MTSSSSSQSRCNAWIPAETTDEALFGRIVEAWSSEPPEVRTRGIALDVALIHIASMSNLMAALGWAFVDLLEHPAHLRRIADGDEDLARRCALESTRMAQRSIMSRAVLAPVDFDTGEVRYRVPAGWTIATLLPLLNTSAAPGLERWDPDRWHRHRLADASALPSPMLVTAFGHGQALLPRPAVLAGSDDGRHDPSARSVRDDAPVDQSPEPVPAQIGGVARRPNRALSAIAQRGSQAAHGQQDAPLDEFIVVSGAVTPQQLDL